MKLIRMFEIIYLLLEKKQLTTAELAIHFEVSKRTILRDIEALAMAGIPVYTSKGRGGGVSLIENYVLNKRMLSNDEQNDILFALKSLIAVAPTDLGATFRKMQTLFNIETVDWLSIDFSRWGYDQSDEPIFFVLKEGILKQRQVSFMYANSSGFVELKEVCPIKLVFKASSWYLQAYCLNSKKYKLYKLNRMYQIVLNQELFLQMNFAAPDIEQQPTTTHAMILIELLFTPECAFRAYDEFSTKCIRKNQDGTLVVKAFIPEDQWVYSFLLSLGTGVTVLAPSHVKYELLNHIKKIADHYS